MLTKKKIRIPIFRIDLLIVVIDKIGEALKIDSRIDINSDSCVIDYNDGNVSIFITPNSIPIIAHECLHVKNSIWNRIGYISQANNDEVDAYLLDYIIAKVLEVVEKHKSIKQC